MIIAEDCENIRVQKEKLESHITTLTIINVTLCFLLSLHIY